MTPDRMLRWLLSFPFPGAVAAMQGGDLVITLEGEVLRFDGAWRALDGQRIPCTLDDASSADDIHAEIRRGLAIARGITGASWHRIADPSPTWEQTKERCVGPDLPGAEQTANDPLYDRATAAQALAKVTAERDQARQAYLDLSTNNPLRPAVNAIAERLGVCPAEPGSMLAEVDRIKGLAAAHAVISQRLVGSQKEVAEVSAERDRLKKQTAAMRVNYAEFERRGQALDEAIARTDKVEDRLRRDDELREQIAAAVGLDGSASLALILDTVTRDRPDDPRGVKDLRALVNYHQAPITFNARPLTLAERAAFVIRRLWQGRTNAAAEAAALRRELGDIEAALGDLPDTAEREPIGDREEHLGLSAAERIRLSR